MDHIKEKFLNDWKNNSPSDEYDTLWKCVMSGQLETDFDRYVTPLLRTPAPPIGIPMMQRWTALRQDKHNGLALLVANYLIDEMLVDCYERLAVSDGEEHSSRVSRQGGGDPDSGSGNGHFGGNGGHYGPDRSSEDYNDGGQVDQQGHDAFGGYHPGGGGNYHFQQEYSRNVLADHEHELLLDDDNSYVYYSDSSEAYEYDGVGDDDGDDVSDHANANDNDRSSADCDPTRLDPPEQGLTDKSPAPAPEPASEGNANESHE
jgi:hypothetical protein